MSDDVSRHYTRGDLDETLLDALARNGCDTENLKPEDLAPFDEFHVRGHAATSELLDKLEFDTDGHVLDVGSGLGGPSRRLAQMQGCSVTGIDLTLEYCDVAALFAERVGLADRVNYQQANALSMPFDDGSFDGAITQHVAMNIEERPGLYTEIARVLKSGAQFGLYDIFQGQGGDVCYPAPWAETPATSFLVPPDAIAPLLWDAGFEVISQRNTTAQGRAWFQAMRAKTERDGPPPLGIHLLLGPVFKEMAANMVRNLNEDRVALVEIVCRKR
ncbi:MAG: methyltransferase domain-containing protein [Alphaproteobacteria bacterium]|jgi:ubiquinone/menaquinone biosynthesis C-methylase UbiE|nr:methyltransferase domain-containing protein [Rhodospirillaceae bacterium]MBT7615068.1 methyltransferase domain-containing protein [Rhodospirillaceae bacterium]MDG2482033.1 methyltransferase domain-containing protein [Alphaproteobacteria bacterium]